MKPDFLDDVFRFRDAAGSPGEEPDELVAVGREHRRKTGRLDLVGVGYGMPPKVTGIFYTLATRRRDACRGRPVVPWLMLPYVPDVAPKIAGLGSLPKTR